MRLALASASPRRRQILSCIGLPFDTIDVDVNEQPLPGEAPESLARRLALEKACAGARLGPRRLVLGADTVVALGQETLGKPATGEDAAAMLRRLRGRRHRVITAVAAARLAQPSPEPDVWCRVAVTHVWMRRYTEAEIAAYVASHDPFDKAGAYAIQHSGFRPVARIEGCFLTVVGLPLPEVYEVLACAGVSAPPVEETALDAMCSGCTDKGVLLRR